MKYYRPVMKIGCTVFLVPEFRRIGIYVAGLKMRQPYRVMNIKDGKAYIKLDTGVVPFPVHIFDPVTCKFALYEKVCIFNSKRRLYSSPMKITGYSDGSYLLINGNFYDSSLLSHPCVDIVISQKESKPTKQTTLNF